MDKKLILSIALILIVVGCGVWIIGSQDVARNDNEAARSSDDTGQNLPDYSEINSLYVAKFGETLTFRTEFDERQRQGFYQDGLSIWLDSIDDSRCKPDVQCIWEGELTITLQVAEGTISGIKEMKLGTVNNKAVALDGYVFTLIEADPDSATIIVEKK